MEWCPTRGSMLVWYDAANLSSKALNPLYWRRKQISTHSNMVKVVVQSFFHYHLPSQVLFEYVNIWLNTVGYNKSIGPAPSGILCFHICRTPHWGLSVSLAGSSAKLHWNSVQFKTSGNENTGKLQGIFHKCDFRIFKRSNDPKQTQGYILSVMLSVLIPIGYIQLQS
jgi:hypothetical protein